MGDPLFFEECALRGGAKLFHQYREMPWCGLGVVILAGHMHDEVGKEGTAHLLEHQVSNGRIGELPAMPMKDLETWLHRQRLTASFGSTALYWTRYGGCAENADFGKIARFLTDLVFQPGMEGDLDREREAVRSERGHRMNDRRARIDDAVDRSAFGDHRRTTATGLPDDAVLDGLTRRDLTDFHRKYYAPINIRFVTLGGVPFQRVAETLDQLVASNPPEAVEAGKIVPLGIRTPVPRTLRFQREDGRPAKIARVERIWRMPMVEDETDTAVEYALNALLHQRLREDLRLVYGIEASREAHFDHLAFAISTKVDVKKVDAVLAEIDRILRDASALRAAFSRRDDLLRPGLIFYDHTCADILSHALSSITDLGHVVTRSETLKRSKAVTERDVLEFVRTRLDPEEAQTVIIEQQ